MLIKQWERFKINKQKSQRISSVGCQGAVLYQNLCPVLLCLWWPVTSCDGAQELTPARPLCCCVSDKLSVSEGSVLLSADTVWGALRGELCFLPGVPALPAPALWGWLPVPFFRLTC